MRRFENCFQKKQQQPLKLLLLFGSDNYKILLPAKRTNNKFHYEIANGGVNVRRNQDHTS
jgi:hypothetical protein